MFGLPASQLSFLARPSINCLPPLITAEFIKHHRADASVYCDLQCFRATGNPPSTIPPEILPTSARPDIVIVSAGCISMVELAVPWSTEDSLASAKQHKTMATKDNYVSVSPIRHGQSKHQSRIDHRGDRLPGPSHVCFSWMSTYVHPTQILCHSKLCNLIILILYHALPGIPGQFHVPSCTPVPEADFCIHCYPILVIMSVPPGSGRYSTLNQY